MTKNVKFRLCGGTFFTLLLEARKPRFGVREHYMGASDGLSEPNVLMALASVIVQDYQKPSQSMMNTIKGNTSDYKQCKNKGGTYFPFGDINALRMFDLKIKQNYGTALNEIAIFCEKFIQVQDSIKKDEKLVKALVELISEDETIPDEQKFYVEEDGSYISKKQLLERCYFCFQSFLLGIFHYSIMRQEAANIGRETYDIWCPPKGRAPRVYDGNVGESWQDISLTYVTIVEPVEAKNVEEAEVVSNEEDINKKEQVKENNPRPAQQMVINITGNNNNVYGHVDTVNNVFGGKKNDK